MAVVSRSELVRMLGRDPGGSQGPEYLQTGVQRVVLVPTDPGTGTGL
ncbi:hypothetical protein [Streptomyces sp. NPDC055632]